MRLRMLPYFLRQTLANIMENRVVHTIGLGTMVASMLIFGSFLLLFVNANNCVKGWGQSMSMSVYLKDGISQVNKERITTFIKKLPGAEIKRVISKEDALKDFTKALGLQAGLLDGLSSNPLPASFEVSFKDFKSKDIDPQRIKNELEKLEGVGEIQYSKEWLRRFEGLMNIVRLVGFVIGGLLCLGVLFIVTNTIKLTIYARKDEIEILKLVGATDWFVKVPFLFEGMFQGLLSGILSLLILFFGYSLLSVKKVHMLSLAMFDYIFIPYQYTLLILFLGLFLGLIGAFLALGRFFDI
ncbi:MAG TPA: hypothetical protein DDW42_01940 [Desulfobacteraceae bacterium]|nr:hypothetical protein [Desulfobacteraceae bacterium]